MAMLFTAINAAYMPLVLEKKQVYLSEMQYKDYAAKNENTIKYAFIGDSHAVTAVNPRYVNGSFNFALYAENYIKSYYRLRKVIEKDGVKIDTLVLEIDPHTFSSVFVDRYNLFGDMWYYSDFVSYDEAYQIYNDTEYTPINYWLEAKFPVLGNGKEFRLIFTKPEFAGIDLGFVSHAENFSMEPDRAGKARRRVMEMFYKQRRVDSRLIMYFKETLRMARDNGIKVVFIRYPQAAEYAQALEELDFANGRYYAEVLAEAESVIGKDYAFLDYSSFFDSNNYFMDTDHINVNGATLLSKRISEDLKGI